MAKTIPAVSLMLIFVLGFASSSLGSGAFAENYLDVSDSNSNSIYTDQITPKEREEKARDKAEERKQQAREKLEEKREAAKERLAEKRAELKEQAKEKRAEMRDTAKDKREAIPRLRNQTLLVSVPACWLYYILFRGHG